MHNEIFLKEPEYLENNSSYWADPEEIKKAHTIKQINVTEKECHAAGLPIISDGYKTYVDHSDTHTLIFGSTGSKKTRLFGMPLINIFALGGESFVTTDPKGELYQKTAGLVSSQGYQIIVLNFRDMTKSSSWNPLWVPYQLYHEGKRDEAVAMLNDFLSVLAAPQRNKTKDIYFIELGFSMALSYMLFFIETATPEEVNITNFIVFFSAFSTHEYAPKLAEYILENSIASVNLKGILTTVEAKGTFGNIASTAFTMFSQFVTQKSLCQLLSNNSIDMREIGKRKTAIYLIVPDEKESLHFLVSIFIKQFYESLIHEAQKEERNSLPIRINFLLDEFGNIPTIPDMHSMITAARSRNIRFFLMTQGLGQLRKKYADETNTIIGNCENLVFLASKEWELLKYISDLCGDIIEKSHHGKDITYPLISTSGLQRLKKDHDKSEVLILHGRNHPFVSVLPDIDWYDFKTLPAPTMQNTQLQKNTLYNAKQIISDIKHGNRPLPFSIEVYGKFVYFEKKDSKFKW